MQNPYTLVRRSLGLTQEALAQRAKVTRQVVINTESGLYLNPPPALTSVLGAHHRHMDWLYASTAGGPDLQIRSRIATAPRTLEGAYLEWVRLTREANQTSFILPKEAWDVIIGSENRWRTYRNLISPSLYGFCKLLVFDVRLLQFFEKDYSTGRAPLKDALSDVISQEEIECLKI